MSTEDDKALLRRAWDEVYGQGRVDSIEELVLDDVIAHEPDGDVRGVEELKRYLATYLAAFPDTRVTVEDVVAEADKVVSRYKFEAPTSEQRRITGHPRASRSRSRASPSTTSRMESWRRCGTATTT